jgi:hypothetical protein
MAHMRAGGRGAAQNAGREEDDEEDEDRDYDNVLGPSSAAPQLPSSSQEDQNLPSSSRQETQMLVNAMLATWRSSNEAGTAWAPIYLAPTRNQ